MNRRFQTNEQIGEYRVLGFIGQGGMGEVYHAIHEKLGRQVAIKVLGNSVSLDKRYKERFLNEARLQARLQHQNIATLYDFQEVGNELLIFMELIDGESLENLIERRFYSTEESLKVFESIVEAIVYVHSYGIIHRDIKSENVKINSSGVPKLLDFGIAKDPNSQNFTQVGGVIGTPNYLAPEQLEGKQATVQTDIWSLGVLLYRMLTVKLPFEHEIFEGLILQIMTGKFVAAELVNSSIPKAVSNVINKCLAKDLSHRYQTATELLLDVRKVISLKYSNEKLVVNSFSNSLFSSPQLLIAAGSGLIFLFLLGLGIWAFSGTTTETATNSKTPGKVVENQNLNVATPRKSEPKIAQTDKKDEPKTIQNVSEIGKKKVRVDTIGGSAEVWRDGQKIGNTPIDVEIGENEIVNLKLKRLGYLDSDEAISGTKKVYTFSLASK